MNLSFDYSHYVGRRITVQCGYHMAFEGILSTVDKSANMVLDDCIEVRPPASNRTYPLRKLGVLIIRGSRVSMVLTDGQPVHVGPITVE